MAETKMLVEILSCPVCGEGFDYIRQHEGCYIHKFRRGEEQPQCERCKRLWWAHPSEDCERPQVYAKPQAPHYRYWKQP